jgi:hypothetical protein
VQCILVNGLSLFLTFFDLLTSFYKTGSSIASLFLTFFDFLWAENGDFFQLTLLFFFFRSFLAFFLYSHSHCAVPDTPNHDPTWRELPQPAPSGKNPIRHTASHPGNPARENLLRTCAQTPVAFIIR